MTNRLMPRRRNLPELDECTETTRTGLDRLRNSAAPEKMSAMVGVLGTQNDGAQPFIEPPLAITAQTHADTFQIPAIWPTICREPQRCFQLEIAPPTPDWLAGSQLGMT